MRNLISFIIRHFALLTFTFFVILSFMLLFKYNAYQKYIFLTSANSASYAVHSVKNSVTSYINLKDTNSDLLIRNAELENKIIALENILSDYQLRLYADSIPEEEYIPGFNYIIAEVINNSISKPYNYILLNKGRADGIEPEMGIVDHNGVIGIIDVVGEHASRAISLLNPKFRLSCKVKDHDFFGSLVWGGSDPTTVLLEEMPRHVDFETGDTIVTSGYSAVFPEGLLVGTIIDTEKDKNDNFLSFKVKLFTDFSQLNIVRVLKNEKYNEISELNNYQTKSNSY
ncbi:MAG: rod shape-determining protein MreC [Muribaculaceae bacterium]|nr:rod shape-determining protein MreC [Muribaculaceae bacterium]